MQYLTLCPEKTIIINNYRLLLPISTYLIINSGRELRKITPYGWGNDPIW
jgi:hypothetical protein